MDSYLSDELLVETNHEVLRHLENCAACRSELAARRELLTQMRSAVKGAPEMQLNPAFAARLRDDLRQIALRPSVWEKLKSGSFVNSPILAATTAACLLFVMVFVAVWFSRSSPTENAVLTQQNQTNKPVESSRPTESPSSQAVQVALRETLQTAVGDHKNCAVHFRLAETPITLEEAAEKYGKFNKDLDKAVLTSLQRVASTEKISGKTAGKIEFVEAHSCIFNGRRFAHIVLRRGKKIISILVTDAEDSTGDETITNQANGNLQVAQFRTTHRAVFVVSDLSERENLTIAETLIPAVRRHIEQAEA